MFTRLVLELQPGARKDWYSSVPHIKDLCYGHVLGLRVQKDCHEILEENDVMRKDISAIIVSHWHFDHSGDTGV